MKAIHNNVYAKKMSLGTGLPNRDRLPNRDGRSHKIEMGMHECTLSIVHTDNMQFEVSTIISSL